MATAMETSPVPPGAAPGGDAEAAGGRDPAVHGARLQALWDAGRGAEAAAAAQGLLDAGVGLDEAGWRRWETEATAAGAAAAVLEQRLEHWPLDAGAWARLLRAAGPADAAELAELAVAAQPGTPERPAHVAGPVLDPDHGDALWDAVLGLARARGDPEAVRRLYAQRLALPLPGLERALEEFAAWLRDPPGGAGRAAEVPFPVRQAVERAQGLRAEREHLEGALRAALEDAGRAGLGDAVRLYVHIEVRDGFPWRARLLFERALVRAPGDAALWKAYADLVARDPYFEEDEAFRVCRRAASHCHAVGQVWAAAVREGNRLMERLSAGAYRLPADAEFAPLREAFEAARLETEDLYAAGKAGEGFTARGVVELGQAYLDWKRREAAALGSGGGDAAALKAAYANVEALLAARWPAWCLEKDFLLLTRYYARLQASLFGDLEEGRTAWERLLERHTAAAGEGGGPGRPPAEVCGHFVEFERQHGTAASARCLYRLFCEQGSAQAPFHEQVLNDWVRFEREAGSAEDFHQAQASVAPQLEALRKKRLATQTKAGKDEKKRAPAAPARPPRKRIRGDGGDVRMEDGPPPRPAGGDGSGNGSINRPAYTDQVTAFVKGVPFTWSDAEFEALFAECGPIKAARLGKDKQRPGRNRGFGYVEFEAEEGLRNALAKDGMALHGKTVFVARSNPPPKPADGPRGLGGGLGGGFGGRGRGRGRGGGRGRGRAGLGFQPGGEAAPPAAANAGAEGARGAAPAGFVPRTVRQKPPEAAAPKSNADFRAMLLGKK